MSGKEELAVGRSLLLKFLNQDSTGMHDINLPLLFCCVVSDQLVTCVASSDISMVQTRVLKTRLMFTFLYCMDFRRYTYTIPFILFVTINTRFTPNVVREVYSTINELAAAECSSIYCTCVAGE